MWSQTTVSKSISKLLLLALPSGGGCVSKEYEEIRKVLFIINNAWWMCAPGKILLDPFYSYTFNFSRWIFLVVCNNSYNVLSCCLTQAEQWKNNPGFYQTKNPLNKMIDYKLTLTDLTWYAWGNISHNLHAAAIFIHTIRELWPGRIVINSKHEEIKIPRQRRHLNSELKLYSVFWKCNFSPSLPNSNLNPRLPFCAIVVLDSGMQLISPGPQL